MSANKRQLAENITGESLAMNVRPLQDRILVRRVEEVEKTRGGIIIPDSAKERPLEGNQPPPPPPPRCRA